VRSGEAERLLVEDLGSEIGAVRPHDGPELGIDCHLREVNDIPKGLEHRALRGLESLREVDVTDEAIGERQPKTMPAEVLDGGDLVGSGHGSGSPRLRVAKPAKRIFVSDADPLGSVGNALAMVVARKPIKDLAVALDVLGQALHELGITLDAFDGASEILLGDFLVARHGSSVPA
jgi:hypothetical protein